MDLDLDLDLSDDKIQDFLKNKLREIQVTNERLTKQLKEREKLSNEETMETEDQPTISLKSKKIFNGKYIICFEINNYGVYPLENLSLILNNNLDYEVTLFESTDPDLQLSAIPTFLSNHNFSLCTEITDIIKKCNKITKKGFLIVKLDIPDFMDNVVKLEGFVAFEQQQNLTEKNLVIPSLELNFEDLEKQDDIDILTMIAGLPSFNLTMTMPQSWTTSMDSTFEIHCSFQKLSISCQCRKYFLAKNIYEQINDTLIVIHAPSSKMPNTYPLTVYSKNLIHTIHHLHKSIRDLLILPSFYDNRYSCTETEENQLTTNIQEEIQFILDFLEKAKLDPDLLTSEEIQKFRLELGKLEEKTDLQHLKLTKYITLFK